jgi:hypothetical protein
LRGREMDKRQFEENLLFYGVDLYQWPEEIRKAGLKALEGSAEIQALLAEQKDFEKVLTLRRYEEPDRNLAQRILSASFQQKQKAPFSLGSFFREVLTEFHFPQPAVAAVSLTLLLILVLGFAIGFLNPFGSSELNVQEQITLEAFLDDEGEVL